ncbi:MAG: phosphoribosylformylglycinamidine cyclo-ligase [Bacteroidetes bacterium 24-39-8]|jgi:phosphoribosylformylglycinamidine cyclo-ligase|nr:MAG: phosphoribosylformylglycinamidine cyclo-ligase [Sphingobacteriia bacterium 35-40-8]OYZ51552.1 MAG: phosphoribosylformylglycinamidine cyclo-ligase [Bacteroidetes bacterium 24-39-8]OZA67799.1 MAG: phosphoribosylformylglycinamidine cyclo-ligase [Sphingobacteriia bacterium 39-39-8]HQR92153.1 AIR synthase-related protein [Sediminibacterium sp.]HQS55415.1 AIR synthase-related protein [Sediminibacterium sp.]
MSLYAQRGVSAQKEEVHAAIGKLDQGLYPDAFCKVYPDFLCGDPDWINIMHADGAGTKSILAYLYWKETGDVSVWKGIAQDAVAMNLDDLLCVGITDNILFSSTIDRNKLLIPGAVLEQIINGTQEFFNQLAEYGVRIHYLGGETADVGDVVRTIAVNGTMSARWPKSKLVTNEKISEGNVIVGFASFGQANYESEYNSGLGSNGLTSARHDVLGKQYKNYPETFEPKLNDAVVYLGKNAMTDTIDIDGKPTNVGKLLLSPTRTYAPLMKQLLDKYFDQITGLIHCSGGGQTKCMKYLPKPLRIVKDNLFAPAPIFQLIQENSGADDREMYQVFNMGHRLEVFTNAATAPLLIAEGAKLGIEAKIVGKVEAAEKKELILKTAKGELVYEY